MKNVSYLLIAAVLPFLAGMEPLYAHAPLRRPLPLRQVLPAKMVQRITPVVPLGYGINIHENQFLARRVQSVPSGRLWTYPDRLPLAGHRTHARRLRLQKYDAQLTQLDAMGVRPVWVVSYTNTLYDENLPPHTDAGLKAFARFAGAAAAHFRNRGVLWEIWNEPNEPNFWAAASRAPTSTRRWSKPPPRRSGRPTPSAPILAGAISQIRPALHRDLPSASSARTASPRSPSIRIATGSRSRSSVTIADVRALIARYTPAGRRPTPIVCSEWGYTTATDQTSEADQGRYIVRMYLVNLLSGVDLTIFYDWTDDGSNPADNESRFGIVRQDLTPKPAYTAIAAFAEHAARLPVPPPPPQRERLRLQAAVPGPEGARRGGVDQ